VALRTEHQSARMSKLKMVG